MWFCICISISPWVLVNCDGVRFSLSLLFIILGYCGLNFFLSYGCGLNMCLCICLWLAHMGFNLRCSQPINQFLSQDSGSLDQPNNSIHKVLAVSTNQQILFTKFFAVSTNQTIQFTMFWQSCQQISEGGVINLMITCQNKKLGCCFFDLGVLVDITLHAQKHPKLLLFNLFMPVVFKF